MKANLPSPTLLSMASTRFKLIEYFFSSLTCSSRVRLGKEALIDFNLLSELIFRLLSGEGLTLGDGVRMLNIEDFVILEI